MILQRYLFRRILFAHLVALGCLGLALFPPSILSALSRLGGVGIRVILGYLPYLSVELLPYLVPMAFLLAVIATFSRMRANGEWVAIQMGHIHPASTALPGLVIAGALSVASLIAMSQFFPALRLRQEDYKRSAALHVVRQLFPGRTTIQLGDFSIVALGRAENQNRFENVVVRLPSKSARAAAGDGDDERPEAPRRIVARAAELSVEGDVLRILFEDAQINSEPWRARSGISEIRLPLDDLLRISRTDPVRPRYMSSNAIRRGLEQDTLPQKDRRLFAYEIERRNALAACYLVFLVLGIPTGLRLGTESMLGPLAMTALYACVYYVLSLRVAKSVLTESIPVWIGAWSANALGVLAALLLVVRWREQRWRRR